MNNDVNLKIVPDDAGVHQLPAVGHIQGVFVRTPGADPQNWIVEIQYTPQRHTDSPGEALPWFGLRMFLHQALYLLNVLEDTAKKSNVDYLRHPPGTKQ